MTKEVENTWTTEALQRGDTDAVKRRAIDEPDYVRQRDFLGDTPLLSAIAFDNQTLVQFLLDHDADPNVSVNDGYSCLLTAIESEAQESLAIVEMLIAAGADIHESGINGWTPLHMAAARGQVAKTERLLAVGADVNRRNEIDGCETPLMEAAYSGQVDTVRVLLEHGADAYMRDTVYDRNSLEIASEAGAGPDPDVVESLRSKEIQIDVDEMFDAMDLSPEQLAMMKKELHEGDMAQTYIDSSNRLVRTGNHDEVIKILTAHMERL